MKLYSMLLAGAALLGATGAAAQTMTYQLRDIGTYATYYTQSTGQTFSGTGFTGVYDLGGTNGASFGHLLGLENGFSKTNAQVDISALLGRTITSAALSYNVLNSANAAGRVTVTGSAGTGALGYAFAAPTSNYGTAFGATLATNTVDVTAILAAASASSNPWLNLFLENTVANNIAYTYTYANYGYNSDSAGVRLNVTYADATAAVPEPATWAMMLLGFGMAGYGLRRRAGGTVRVAHA